MLDAFTDTFVRERSMDMNKDQAKGHVKDIAGKAREKIGEMTGNRSEQAKGIANQAEGKVQKGVGDLKNATHDKDKDR
jgi:uncharacterized protein YjbJ (UPF0337 family)